MVVRKVRNKKLWNIYSNEGKKLNKILAKLKVYIGRSGTYISIINFILILATFKQSYNIKISAFLFVPIGILLGLILGYIDYKFILKHETKLNNQQNNIQHQIDRIENLLKEKR